MIEPRFENFDAIYLKSNDLERIIKFVKDNVSFILTLFDDGIINGLQINQASNPTDGFLLTKGIAKKGSTIFAVEDSISFDIDFTSGNYKQIFLYKASDEIYEQRINKFGANLTTATEPSYAIAVLGDQEFSSVYPSITDYILLAVYNGSEDLTGNLSDQEKASILISNLQYYYALSSLKHTQQLTTTGAYSGDRISTDGIQDSAITTDKLATNSVSTAKIQNEAITTDKIQNGSVTNDKLAINSINENNLNNHIINGLNIVRGITFPNSRIYDPVMSYPLPMDLAVPIVTGGTLPGTGSIDVAQFIATSITNPNSPPFFAVKSRVDVSTFLENNRPSHENWLAYYGNNSDPDSNIILSTNIISTNINSLFNSRWSWWSLGQYDDSGTSNRFLPGWMKLPNSIPNNLDYPERFNLEGLFIYLQEQGHDEGDLIFSTPPLVAPDGYIFNNIFAFSGPSTVIKKFWIHYGGTSDTQTWTNVPFVVKIYIVGHSGEANKDRIFIKLGLVKIPSTWSYNFKETIHTDHFDANGDKIVGSFDTYMWRSSIE